MAVFQDLNKMLKQKKSRKLFWGMLGPLLFITITACTFFYIVSNQILKAYMTKELELSVEKMTSSINDSMKPIIVNVDDFVTFAGDYDDTAILKLLIDAFGSKLDEYASMLYYAPAHPKNIKSKLITNIDWVPPEDIEWTERIWFTEAVKNQGKTTYSSPYVDANTNELCVTISQAVYNKSGELNGVIGCDILLSKLVSVIHEISISKNCRIHLITKEGFYLTHDNPDFIMIKNWKNETLYKGDFDEWLNGELKTSMDNKYYFAVS